MTHQGNRRPPIIWVWHDWPARAGAGSQQRAALILDALAEVFQVHILIVGGRQGGARRASDAELAESASWREVGEAEAAAAVVCLKAEVAAAAVVLFDFTTAVKLRPVLGSLGPVYIDLDELLSKRQSRFLATPGLAVSLHEELKRGLQLFRMLERRLLPIFRGVFVASAVEKENLRTLVDLDVVTVVPNGTRHHSMLPPVNREAPRVILFVGRMDYFPNHDAAQFFLTHVWPRLRARYGERVRFHLVGRHAPASFRPQSHPGVDYSPCCEDVVPAYEEASLAVVPLRSGGGTRIKILEACALGRPVVSTTVGAEGLGMKPGQHLLIADDPEAFFQACVELLEGQDRAAALVAAAGDYVRRHHSAAAIKRAVHNSLLVRRHVAGGDGAASW